MIIIVMIIIVMIIIVMSATENNKMQSYCDQGEGGTLDHWTLALRLLYIRQPYEAFNNRSKVRFF